MRAGIVRVDDVLVELLTCGWWVCSKILLQMASK